MTEQLRLVEVSPALKSCQVCLKETNASDVLSIWKGSESLADVCVWCWADGILWAARQAKAEKAGGPI